MKRDVNLMELSTDGRPKRIHMDPARLVETLERLRLISRMDGNAWHDLLGVTWKEYNQFKAGMRPLPTGVFERIARRFDLDCEGLMRSQVDFRQLALQLEEGGSQGLPEAYRIGAHGRCRTSIAAVDYLEDRHGWRLRLDALRGLKVPESALTDPFARISIRFVADLLQYLSKRQFRAKDFFAMGAYSYIGNRHSLVARIFNGMRSPAELYDFFFHCSLSLFENNCHYTLKILNDERIVFEQRSNPVVAEELRVRHVGSSRVCDLKSGFFSVLPMYLELSPAQVVHSRCVHRGDDVCEFDVDFSRAHFELSRRAWSC